MAAILRHSTPPPSEMVRVPQTPRYGYDDDYQPYRSRKSARISERASTVTAVTPKASRSLSYPTSDAPFLSSTPSSPPIAKKRGYDSLPETGSRRVSGALTMDSASHAASALGLSPQKDNSKKVSQASVTVVRRNAMLPTPAKTPKKRPDTISPAVTDVARNLFAIRPGSDEIMPSPRKKRHTGFSVGGAEDEESEPIQIYTDSQDRIPEVDDHEDNPFYGKEAARKSPTKQSSRRQRKVHIDGEGEVDLQKTMDRDDGFVVNFRGRKSYKKFKKVDSDTEQGSSDTEVTGQSGSPTPRGKLTRSSVRPRRLFARSAASASSASTQAKSTNTEDEEADTDIEEAAEMSMLSTLSTPTSKVFDATTPKAPKFGAFTPPTTGRATRTMDLDLDDNATASDVEMTLSTPIARAPHGLRGTASDDEMVHASTPIARGLRGAAKADPFTEWSSARDIPKETKKRATDATSGGVVKKARF